MSFLRGARATRLPSRKVLEITGILVTLALIAGSAILATGFDVKNVKLNPQNIWVLQKGTGNNLAQRFGQVNTEINELTKFNSVDSPSALVQSAAANLLFAGAFSKFVNISSVEPADFNEDTETAIGLESSASAIEVGTNLAAIVSSDGKLLVTNASADGFGAPELVSLPAGVQKVNAVAVDSADSVTIFSLDAQKILTYNSITEKWAESSDTVAGLSQTAGEYELANVGNRWVLLDKTANQLWIRGSQDPVSVEPNSLLQRTASGAFANSVYLSTPASIYSVNLDTRENNPAVEVPGGVVASRPLNFQGVVYASWLSAKAGWFFSSQDNSINPLNFGAKAQLPDPGKLTTEEYSDALTIHSNGSTAVINDTYSGWAWSLPTGAIIVGTQDWDKINVPPPPCEPNCKDVKDLKKPKPPVAVSDKFGVRAGSLVTLPVLLNDYDPNRNNVITIVPESVQGLNSNFGKVSVSSEQQTITVLVDSNARGSASFSYKVTDGTGTPNSNSARVTLSIVADSKNSAPVWCSEYDSKCLQLPPEASVSPGSEVSIPFLRGWVDPDGDRFFISRAAITAGQGNIAFTAAGDLVYQNDNAGETKSSIVTVMVEVSDIFGKSTEIPMDITVRAESAFTFAPPVLVLAQEEPTVIDFAKFTSGTAGSLGIVNLEALTNRDNLKFEQLDSTRVRFTASAAKPSQMTIKVRDNSGAEVESLLRVNVVSSEQLRLSTAPVTVLVSQGLDTSIDVFAAAQNPANRALVVSDVRAVRHKASQISASKIKGGNLRIRGQNVNGVPGFAGVIRYVLSDGNLDGDYKTEGQAFVYVMPDPEDKPAVARRDVVTVRAGQSAQVDVLANDLGAPGIPLQIDSRSLVQEEETSCIPGGLIFAAGGKIRILAPMNANRDYSCGYQIFASNNPGKVTKATITINVVADDKSNQAPVALDLVSRVRAGETVSIPVPTAGVDVDGDSVLVQALSGVKGKKGAAYISPDGTSIEYTALSEMTGQDTFTYTLVDSRGAVSEPASVKVAILSSEPETAPVTFNDYAEVLIGANNKVVMDPLSNDFDPQANPEKPMSLVEGSVSPAAPSDSPNFKLWKAALSVKGNSVTIKSGTAPMTMTFVYTAQGSSGSRNTGYITVRIREDAVDDAPDITDTFVTRAQRQEFETKGIDVVSKKVVWTSGDVNSLTLSIWGDAQGYKADKTFVSGTKFPDEQKVVIFKLSGTNFYGKTVSSYGFLHLPGTKPKITFDPSASTQLVDEGKSKSFDMASLTNLESGLILGKVKAHGARDNATCSITSGTTVTYNAGSGAPWTDFCNVEVKISGTDEDFISLLVPIKVNPKDPQPELKDQELVIVQGTSSKIPYDLVDMTIWPGKTEADKAQLQYQFEGGDDLFSIERGDGNSKLEIAARGSSPAGSKRIVKVSLRNYPNTKPANLVLVVGQLPDNIPIAPTLTLECTVADGESNCQIPSDVMNSTPGTYNPYPETPLNFAPFGYTTGEPNYSSSARACGKVTIRTEASRIYAVWKDKPTGIKCTVPYNVLDREGRLGKGSLEFAFSGIPGNVKSVSQVDFSRSTLTLEIVPPDSAFPAITDFLITNENGEETSCDISPTGTTRCIIYNLNPYDGLDKKNLHTYSVVAQNEQGISKDPKELKGAYAYKAPKQITRNNIDDRTATVYDPDSTVTRGHVNVVINPVADSSIERYEISGGPAFGTESIVASTSYASFSKVVGAAPGKRSRITVTAIGRVLPPVPEVAETNSAVWIGQVAATPKIGGVSAKTVRSGGAWVATLAVSNADRNWSDKTVKAIFAMYTGTVAPTCSWDSGTNELSLQANGGATVISEKRDFDRSEQQQENLTVRNLRPIQDNTAYTPFVCYSNFYGYAEQGGARVSTLADPVDGAFTYDVSRTPDAKGAWLVKLGNSETKAGVKPFFKDFNGTGGWEDTIYSTTYGAQPDIRVRYCKLDDLKDCSDGKRVVSYVVKSRSWQMKITSIDKLIDLTTIEGDPSSNGETSICTRNHNIDFKLAGSGIVANGKNLWQLDENPTFVRTNNTTSEFESLGTGWRIPSGVPLKTISIKVRGSQNANVKGLDGALSLNFTCSQ